jgi:glc operon protein GlcG
MKKLILLFLLPLATIAVKAQRKIDKTNKIMNTKIFLSQKVAKQIAELAEQEAIKNNWTVSIAIVNEFGQLTYFTKMDESTNASVDISIAKAKHSAYYRRDTKFHQDLLSKGNNVVLSLPNAMPIEGGVQLTYNGKTIGAIGVSGAASEDDGRIAKVGADFLYSLK